MANDLTHYKQQLAQQAKVAVEQETLSGGTVLSTRGGTLVYGEETLPGNQACIIILDAIKENTFYEGKFDPDVPAAPICYAMGRGPDDADMAPHESMMQDENYFVPQAESCQTCPMNEWGSADKGRGKACQNRRRLSLIPAGSYIPKRGSRDFDLELFDDPKDFEQADIAFLKLPVLSVKEYAKFVHQVSTNFNLPPHGVICRIWVEPDAKAQYKVCFEVIEAVPDELLPAIMAKHDEALAMKYTGYRAPEERAPAHTENPRGSLRNIRR